MNSLERYGGLFIETMLFVTGLWLIIVGFYKTYNPLQSVFILGVLAYGVIALMVNIIKNFFWIKEEDIE